MVKARSRTTARKIKDKWKAKSWYTIVAPTLFDNAKIADTLAGNPNSLMNRVTEISLQDLTNDFRKSHIKLFFKINKVEEGEAITQFTGHTLTSDYVRRMIRRRRSKIDGIYDVSTRDGAIIRVKPFATTDKRIQNSQKRIIREAMKKTISEQAKTGTLSEFIKNIIDGKTGSDIYKNCKTFYPVKRVEIFKTQVLSQPTIKEEKKITKKEEPKEKEIKEKAPKKKEEKKTKAPMKTKEKATPVKAKEKITDKKQIEKPVESKKSKKKPIEKTKKQQVKKVTKKSIFKS